MGDELNMRKNYDENERTERAEREQRGGEGYCYRGTKEKRFIDGFRMPILH